MNKLIDIGLNKFGRAFHRAVRYSEKIPLFSSDDVQIGANTQFGRNVVFNCEKVRIGDGVKFGNNVQVDATEFYIGDYATVYSDCFFPGPGIIRIGHNFWVGKGAIIDTSGGTTIGNNVGVGGQSQLWTHISFGDTLAGCQFDSSKHLWIGDDVWFVGHCLVSPIRAESRSLAMLGSLIIKDMSENRCYAGSPAKDMTDKMGYQFNDISPDEMRSDLESRIREFKSVNSTFASSRIGISMVHGDTLKEQDFDVTFNVQDRTYTKTGSLLESALIRYLLPKAKFIPTL